MTAAEVNLKFVWDVVSRIKIGGTAGSAYVVDADGALIAHPDISLVLKKSDLSALPQVAALLQPGATARPPVARDLKGEEVLVGERADPDAALDRVRRVAARRGVRAALRDPAATVAAPRRRRC